MEEIMEKKEMKRKRGRPPKKQKENQNQQQNVQEVYSEKENKSNINKSIDIETALRESELIKALSQGLVDVSQSVFELNKKTDERIAQTEQKIGELANAVSLLSEQFTKFLSSFNNVVSNNHSNQDISNTDNNNPNVSSQPGVSISREDKLMYWANLLTRLAELNRPVSAPPSSSTEEGLARGFDLMMGVVTKLMQIQTALRKNFLEELRDTFTLFPKVLKETKGQEIQKEQQKKEIHLETE